MYLPSKRKRHTNLREKKYFFVGVLKVTDEKSRIPDPYPSVKGKVWILDPNPDPYQNVTDPEHFFYFLDCAE